MEQTPQAMLPEYKIIKATELETLENLTLEMLVQGWQLAGPIGHYGSYFYHEMMRLVPDPKAQEQEAAAQLTIQESFDQHLEQMDQKVKDLLEINNIELMYMDGRYYTKVGEKVHEGIDPNHVLQVLKASKHYPLDMDDSVVLNAIESIV